MFPIPVWLQGTVQPSTPVNDAFLRTEILARGATSIISTPPGSPADGQVHILGASPTDAWSTFAQNDVVMWRSGTWYRYAPFLGWLKQVGADVRRFDGEAWVVVSGGVGGAVPVQYEGAAVASDPTAINFVGSGVTVTNVGGVATVSVPGGGGGSSGILGDQWSAYLVPTVGSGGFSVLGIPPPNTVGTVQGIAISAANKYGGFAKTGYRAGAAVNAVTGVRSFTRLFYRGLAGRGGFKVKLICGLGTGPTASTHRFFIGVVDNIAAIADVNPSTLTNCIGLGYDSADTQVHIVHNDASGTATKVSLGASFPKPNADESFAYELTLTAVPGDTSVSYEVRELVSGATATGQVSTDLPSDTTLLTYHMQLTAGGTAVQLQIEPMGVFIGGTY